MKNFMWLLKSIVIICFMLKLLPSPVLAITSEQTIITEHSAFSALKQAIDDNKARLKHYKEEKQAITLIETSEDSEGNIFQQVFIPEGSENGVATGSWKTLRQDSDFNQSVSIASEVIFDSKNFDLSKAKLISESHSTWVFSIANIVNVNSDEQISNQQMGKIEQTIANKLFTELLIDKQSQQIRALKIYTKEPFKQSFMVNIEKFEIRLSFAQAWPNGPLIRQNLTRHIVGRFGWLVEINELITTKTSKVAMINMADAMLAL